MPHHATLGSLEGENFVRLLFHCCATVFDPETLSTTSICLIILHLFVNSILTFIDGVISWILRINTAPMAF